MPITPQYPSGYNTYVPNTQATNNLIIDFARNINDFKLNQYTQIIKVDTNVGLFTRMTNEVCLVSRTRTSPSGQTRKTVRSAHRTLNPSRTRRIARFVVTSPLRSATFRPRKRVGT